MQQVIVTVEEARLHLSELIAHVLEGDTAVIAEGGKSLACLTQPFLSATPEEVASARTRASETIKDLVKEWINSGIEIPPGSRLQELLD